MEKTTETVVLTDAHREGREPLPTNIFTPEGKKLDFSFPSFEISYMRKGTLLVMVFVVDVYGGWEVSEEFAYVPLGATITFSGVNITNNCRP